MPNVAEIAVEALEPYVGRMVAETCVRATALSAGKFSDSLTSEDLPALEMSIRRLLGPVAPLQAIETICEHIREECRR